MTRLGKSTEEVYLQLLWWQIQQIKTNMVNLFRKQFFFYWCINLLIPCIFFPAIEIGQKSIILGSPESLIKWADKLADDTYSRSVVGLIIDECHSIIDWNDFRPVYTRLADLKSIVASAKPWGLFTATCDSVLKEARLKSISLQSITTIAATPDM